MKVYIAAPFFTPTQIEIVQSVELALKSEGVRYYSPRSEGTLKNMSIKDQRASRKKIFDLNVWHMEDCTHMIACVEHKDTGTIWEMGFFYAQSKPIIMLSYDLRKVNVMLAEAASGIARNPFQAVGIFLGKEESSEIESYT